MRKRARFSGAVVAAIAFLFSGGCFLLREAVVPMPAEWHRALGTPEGKRLYVYLPGRGGAPGDFERRGLLAALQERGGASADFVAIDAHLNYYRNRSVADRVVEDIVGPARQAGYAEVWAVGISLGGLGAIVTERMYPGTWDGMVLLAPFLGDDEAVFDEIRDAGGLEGWEPQATYSEERYTERIWTWLKAYAEADEKPFPLYLGYGASDWLSESNELFARSLAPERVRVVPGGHRWPVWSALWAAFLEEIEAADRGVSPRTPR